MSDGRPVSGAVKKYVFRSQPAVNGDTRDVLELLVPERFTGGYSFYTWPAAPLLAWYLWTQRRHLRGRRLLELSAGTALPGLLAAKCGARVTLTDGVTLPRSLDHIATCCEANGLRPGVDITIAGLSWGLLLADVHSLRPLDLVIASDCFYEPAYFEDILATVSFLIEGTDAKFLCTYQERSADWSVEALLKKWGLRGALVDLESIGDITGVDYRTVVGERALHLLEITSA